MQLKWDQTGERRYETGVDHGVLYQIDSAGEYGQGVAWNGLTAVTESPSGAEASPQYADNMKYLNLISAEEFGATIEAFTYPEEFEQNDGSASPTRGVSIGQQPRKPFGFCWRTIVGNDIAGNTYGEKLHLVYGALAAPSEKPYATVNDSPEAMTLSWEVTTTPVEVGTIAGVYHKPTASLVVDSTKVDPAKYALLKETLYGTIEDDPRMPLPAEVFAMMMTTLTTVSPTEPTYNAATDTVTIPTIAGVEYRVNGEIVTGSFVITESIMVKAYPETGYKFPAVADDDWTIVYS